ncbi:MAG: SDR family oxidoreductase [Chitinophagia bacterium]|jgi:NAD(P)-dependent dehydrogenase (short-subunit alcohol dehydrogenase family)|nr:SDR family oxidoreductase [Chitinophagia bacterium]
MKGNQKSIVVVIGAGSIGQAIARRVGFGKHIILADLLLENAETAAKVLIDAGFETSTEMVDISSRESVQSLVNKVSFKGEVEGLILAAGVSPTQASPKKILEVDLYGTALVLEAFRNVISNKGSGVVIASMAGHRLPPLTIEQNKALATTPVEELLDLPFLQPDTIENSRIAYMYSKRGNSLRVAAEALKWANRGARLNTISPGIIITPLANEELSGPLGDTYRRMISTSPAGRAGSPDEVANVAALLMSRDGSFITGSDFLIDGGVNSAYWYGDLSPNS